jgi:hypothetical protein
MGLEHSAKTFLVLPSKFHDGTVLDFTTM